MAGKHFTITMLIGYVAFSSLPIIGRVAEPLLGEFADMLAMSAVLWPYPFMLALQTWIPPGTLFGAFFVGGLLVTVLWGRFLQRRFPALSNRTWWSRTSGLLGWCIPVVLLELAVIAAVWAMGFPIGE